MGALDRVFREQAGRPASLEDLSLSAMKAMQEPTDGMLEAGRGYVSPHSIFTAMLSNEIAAAEEAR
ncbi:hypothetical protein [Xanthobacter versatilis]|uniref:hypothetical protein n=1 Tax=Xanthobacter autotrophicus (strain ATCC BAA-1158 / Py2) TaxID=78245 RepID=UPI003728488F